MKESEEQELWRQLGAVSAMIAGVAKMLDEFEQAGRPTASARELLTSLETVQARFTALMEQASR
jgi:hypothetical protein